MNKYAVLTPEEVELIENIVNSKDNSDLTPEERQAIKKLYEGFINE